jgi:hypothetical protein
MTGKEQLLYFYDILESSNQVFRTTQERPISDVVYGYLNEAQISLFNTRYMPSTFIDNIGNIKAFKSELKDLLVSSTVTLSDGTKYSNSKTFPWSTEEHFVDGLVTVTRTIAPAGADIKVDLVPILDININKYLTTYVNMPVIVQPVVFPDKNSNTMCILHDSFTTMSSSAIVTVLNKPIAISDSQDCRLDKKFHEQIVRSAVTLYLNDKLNLAKNDSNRNAD